VTFHGLSENIHPLANKCKTLHKWCVACNCTVSSWHWLLLAVNQ